MTSTRTRLLAAIAAATLLLGAGACGSDDKKDAKPSSSTSTTDNGATPSGDATGDSDSSSDIPKTLTKDEFADAVISAMTAKKTAHMVMDLGGTTANADVRFGTGATTAMHMDMQVGGQKLDMIIVDSTVYLQQGAGQKYLKVTKSTPGFGQLLEQLQNMGPDASIRAMKAGLQSVKYVGPDTVDGTEVAKYAVAVDTAKMAKASGNEAMQSQLQSLPKTVTYDVYLDADKLMRRMVMSIAGQNITMTFSKWGEPVDIHAPPASQVTTQK